MSRVADFFLYNSTEELCCRIFTEISSKRRKGQKNVAYSYKLSDTNLEVLHILKTEPILKKKYF